MNAIRFLATPTQLALVLPFFATPTPVSAATVSWDGGGGNSSWHTAANWSNDTLPGAGDDVIINVAGEATISFATGSVSVRSLHCEEAFQLTGGALTVTAGASFVHGGLRLNGGELLVLGATASFTASGSATNTGTHLTARDGGQISLPTLTHLVRSTVGDLILTADGTNSSINVPNLTVGGAADFYQLAFYALNGGRVLAPSMNQMNGAIEAVSRGGGSVVDLSGLQGTFRNTTPGQAYLEARDGGAIQIPNVTALDRVNLSLYGDALVPTAQLQAVTGAEIYLQRTTNNFPGLTNIFSTHLTLALSARATLSGITRLGRTNVGSVTLTVSDPGTILELPNVTNAVIEPFYQLELIAYSGARLSLPKLRVMDGGIEAYADGLGAVVDLPGLQGRLRHPKAGGASLEARNGGSVLVTNVIALERIDVTLHDRGFISLAQVKAFNDATMTLDRQTNSFPGLTNVTSASFTAANGARLTLSGVTYVGRTNAADAYVTASDNGVLDFPNLLVAHSEPFYQVEMEASAGGQILTPRLATMDGAIIASARGNGSRIDLSGFSGRLANGNPSLASLQVLDGASILLPKVTALERVDLTIQGNGQIHTAQLTAFTLARLTLDGATGNFPALVDITGSSLFADNSANLTLPGVTQLIRTNVGTLTLTAEEPGTVLNLPNLTSVLVQPFYQLELFALRGGRVLLPALSAMQGALDVLADGTNSVVDLSSLLGTLTPNQAGLGYLEARAGGAVLIPNVTALDQYNLTLRNTGTLNTEQLTAITRATVTLDNTIGVFPTLTDTTGTTFTYLNGGTGVFHPPADFVISAITAPASVVAGKPVTIMWEVTNLGSSITNGNWSDGFYLSSDFAPGNDQYLGLVSTAGNLASGASRWQTNTVVLPAYRAGTWHLAIVANHQRTVFEGTNIFNNTNVSVATIEVQAPDLVVEALTLTTNAARLGQSIGVSWRIRNAGTATATGSWFDRLLLIPPANQPGTAPILLEKIFTEPLAPGASSTHTETVPLPLLPQLAAGTYTVTAYTDTGNAVAESAETNNTAGAAIAITLPSLPDLAVARITSPATGLPGQAISVVWAVTNQGNAAAIGAWTENVFVAATNAGAPAQIVATFSFTNDLPAAAFLSRTQQVVLPANLKAGLAQLRIAVDAEQTIAEQNETNNVNVASQLISVPAALALQVALTSIVENASSSGIAALVSRNSDVTSALTVTLSSSDTNELTVPASLQIPAGKSSAAFVVTHHSDGIFDADALITLTATATAHASSTAEVTVVNTDAPRLHLTLTTNSVVEGTTTSATVSHDAGSDHPVTVFLSSPNSHQIILPGSVIIPAGQTSAVFVVTAADDTFVELGRSATIVASAPSFVGSSTGLTIEDNDLLQLTLSLRAASVREDAGTTATTATVSRGQPSPRPLVVELENSGAATIAVPAAISIPAGQSSVSFPIAVINDGLINGSRTAQIRAFALASDSSRRVAASAPVLLTVTDDDSPALSVVSARDIVVEGLASATMLTVSRNEASAQPLVVNLASSAPGEATVPATATIPAGQSAVIVPLTSVNDQIIDGSKPVQITASAPGFASGAVTVVVTDSNQPDLIVAEIAGPTSAETEAFINVSYRIANQGLTSAGTNWLTRLFLSSDPVVGDDTPLAEYPFSGTLPVGQSFGQSRQVRAPQAPGNYWLVVKTDTENQIDEWSEQNNTRVSAQPIQIVAAYQAVVGADLTSAPAGTVVPLHGAATKSGTGGPAPFVLVNIHVHLRGTKRVFSALTDADGQFAVNFTPLPGEAGLYEIGAAHPGFADAPVQDSFTLFGLRAAKAVPLRLLEQSSVNGQIEIENLGDLPLTGLTATVVSNTPNVNVTATLANSLPGLAKAPLGFAIAAGTAATVPARIVLRVASTQGAQADIPMEITVESRRPRLITDPGELVAGMKVGGQAFVQFDVVNAGGATSAPVHVVLPEVPWMHVVTPNPFPPLAPGATNRVTLQLTPTANQTLGAYDGTIGINAGTVGVSVPFSFRALSEAKGDLRVTAVDEYTYFAEGSPKVAGAAVTVRDAVSDEPVATGVTDAAGQFRLNQIVEGYYTIELTADRHSRYRQIHLVVAGQTNDVVAFLRREAVRYTWIVVPTEIGDRTRVTIETVFEAFVPMPVVTVDPPLIDLAEYSADVTQIDLKVMNHGLIAAKHAKLSFGTHPDWSFELLISELGDIPARSSMTVPLLIRRTGAGSGRGAGAFTGLAQVQFSAASGGGGCTVSGSCQYDFECGGNTLAGGFPVPVINASASGCGADGGGMAGGGDGYGGRGNGSGGGGPTGGGEAPSSCNTCLLNLAKAAINCALKFILSDALKCAKDTYGCASGIQAGPTAGTAYTCGKAIINCLKAAGRSIPLTSLLKYPECAYGLLTACNGLPGGGGGGGGNNGGGLAQFSAASDAFVAASTLPAWPPIESVAGAPMPPELRPLALRLDRYQHFLQPMLYTFNNPAWLADGDTNRFTAWLGAFLARIELNTDDGGKVSASERAQLVALPLPPSVTVANAHTFIDRWNRSMDYWNAGIFTTAQVPAGQSTDFLAWDILGPLASAGLEAFEQSEREGYEDPIDAIEGYKLELQRFLTEGDSGGVCARVRLQLDQEAVMTRDAFSATLEIANDTFEELGSVSIELNVRRRDGLDATELFAVRPPLLSGLTAVDGTGVIAPNTTGKATWTLIPTTDAAVNGPEDFLVGGVLRYHHDGLNLTVPLAPYYITVHPSPSLAVKYFHQRDVFADDPFTTEIEPAVPFSLAVMVENRGRGAARNVHIDSAQPRIIENEKGLLVDFKIIATEVAGRNLEPSLTVNFGQIDPGTNAIGRWLLTSTILGGFVDYSATFEHLDALGDKKLALIEGVEIHELIHVVKAPGALDDSRPDFLVNDVPDLFDHPDTVHLSDGSLAPVSYVTTGSFNRAPTSANLVVQLSAPLSGGFAYLRLPDPGTNRFRLARMVRSDGAEIPVGDNVWTTDHTFLGNARRPLRENVLHLFDHNSTGIYTLYYANLPAADIVAPSSAVAALPADSTAHIPVNWSGLDNAGGSGIATFDVFVSTDGGPFTRWIWDTIDRSATFQGALGRTYAFYSIAIDAAGNREDPPFTADAITTVSRTNHAPTLDPIANRVLREGEVLVVQLVAFDVDGDALVFSLTGDAPAGAVIHPYTGLITWVTSEGLGAGVHNFAVQVLDNGAPRLGTIRTFAVTVTDDNLPPVLWPISNRTINEGRLLSITNRVVDYDFPMQDLTFRLEPGAPGGAGIDPTTGVFTWQPASFQGGTTNRISVVVTDNGSPSMSTTQSFAVIVRDTQSDFTVGFATTNVLAGQDGIVPLELKSGADLSRLDFELEAGDPHLAGLALQPLNQEVTALSFEPGTSGRFHVRVDLDPNRAQAGSRTLASLGFSTLLAGHSSIAHVHVGELEGYRSGGETIANTAAQDGRIFIIESEPLLDTALVSSTNSISVILYGMPGHSYRIESHDTVGVGGTWTPEAIVQLNDTRQALERPRGNERMRFFRAVRQ